MELYPFQQDGVSNLMKRRSVLLADEMGLGKTVQAVAAATQLLRDGAIRRVLVVCPASLCRNWRKEVNTWGVGIRAVLYEGADRFGMLGGGAPVLIGSYETVAEDLRVATHQGERFCDIGVDLVILDEAQRIKAPDSLKTRVLSRIMAPRRWAITGTPLENHPRELASILRFLFPNEFSADESLDDYGLLLRFRDGSMLRRTKASVGLELPPKTVATVPVAMSPDQAAEYDQVLSVTRMHVVRSSSHDEAATSLLAGLQHLRRIAVISANKVSAKIDLLCEEVPEVVGRGEKVVVFSSFTNLVLPEVAARLSPYGALVFTGQQTQEERLEVHERFLNDPHAMVMCASLRAAGVGLTWTVATVVYQTDIWWNPQALRQAEDRVHRIGQAKPVVVKRLISDETIESAIEGLTLAKEEIFDAFVDERGLPLTSGAGFEGLLRLIGMRAADLPLTSV